MDPPTNPVTCAGTLARQMIDADIVNPPSLSEIAMAAGLSPFQMSRLFYRVNGVSIPEYIRRLRVDAAEELLKSTQLNIGEVAVRVGYKSMAAFSRAFLRERGKNPSALRRDDSDIMHLRRTASGRLEDVVTRA
ncbi:AraC-like DNA-binding protein [Roseimicrobium gellanilyticum]|uniref:AraC-like DNA-binding protein n=1 Tax=Roseimicrobium gellanilyticum TaxID=748857 RepID=A0A366H9V1_9BACT|nr:AraC family transcriptional regulator [Roseimicrobium gellanilyticum]RBP39050.1 AraC-like DNA-binding protein [Roseimicrobium gellanilyticum]